jgi:hypothetical protein
VTIKVGTRVRVSYEGTVLQGPLGDLYFIARGELREGETDKWIHSDHFEVIAEPLRVGDVITADTPEPPDGTTIMDQSGECARRDGDLWRVTWGGRRTWEEFARVHLGSRHITWTVQHVGDGAS